MCRNMFNKIFTLDRIYNLFTINDRRRSQELSPSVSIIMIGGAGESSELSTTVFVVVVRSLWQT